MKQSLLRTLLLTSISTGFVAAEWGDSYRMRIDQIKQDPSKERIMALAGDIASEYRYSCYRTPAELLIANIIRDELCQIPGHAQYFADEIERERAALVPDDDRISFDRHRSQYLRETLKHLPSPETIRVLGNYLFDDRDPMPPMEPGQDWVPVLPNPLLALKTLAEIGLREAPVKPDTFFDYWNPEPLPGVRAWYEEIKSGKRAFSFKGQSVEYRFKPDGTWVSTPIANPPDDAPAPPPAKSAQPAPSHPSDTPPPPASPEAGSGRIWPWITGGVLTVLAAIAYCLKSRRSHAG